MIVARYLDGRRRRPVFTSLRGLTLPTSPVLGPMARQVSLNTPSIPQPGVMRTIIDAMPSSADAGQVGDEETKQAFFILEEESAPNQPHAFLQNEEGQYIDSEGHPVVDSLSPSVAPQGGFFSTWGPPLLAVAGIGLAVWILRR